MQSCVLDLGSGKITALVGARGANGTINLLGSGEAEYGGFQDGEFLEPDKLGAAITAAVDKAQSSSRLEIGQLFVGVPGEFSTVVVKDVNINFPKPKRVAPGDVDELFAIGREDLEGNTAYEIVNQGGLFFQTDNNRRVAAPEGLFTTKLSARISYVLCERRFIELIKKILLNLGINDIEFVSAPLAEALYLFPPDKRDLSVYLLDVGFITSTLVLAQGEGLEYMRSFSVGGGHITGDLMQVFGTQTFADAESVKRKIMLSLDTAADETYEAGVGGGTLTFPAAKANEVAAERIKMLAEIVGKCLVPVEDPSKRHAPLYLTGGGLLYIKGAKELLARFIGRSVEAVIPSQPMLNRPNMSSALGLLNMAIDQTPGEIKVSLLRRFINKIKGK